MRNCVRSGKRKEAGDGVLSHLCRCSGFLLGLGLLDELHENESRALWGTGECTSWWLERKKLQRAMAVFTGFAVPEVAENADGWGPGAASVPASLQHVPYAPFSKADRLGRASDWTAQAFKFNAGGLRFSRFFRLFVPSIDWFDVLWSVHHGRENVTFGRHVFNFCCEKSLIFRAQRDLEI